MSSETLRQAAEVIRRDWPVCACDECAEETSADREFHHAVAEWLETEAEYDDEQGCFPTERRRAALAAASAYLRATSDA